jgi:hypothetical protein
MKSKWKTALQGTLGLAVLALVVSLLLWMVIHLWDALLSIDKEITATIIATSGTILVAVGTLVYSQRRAKERDIAEAHRARKVEIYSEFMKMIVDVLRHTKAKERRADLPDLPSNVEEFFYKFTQESIVWASPGIIQGWHRFKVASQTGNVDVLLLIDDILREIRRDLGNSNKGLGRGHLIRLFINDPEKLDQALRK